MLRALWYLIKIIIIVGIALFLLAQEGDVVMTWQDYHITIELGFVAASLFISYWIIMWAGGFATRVSLWPREIARARRESRRERGYKFILESLTASSLGDQQKALQLAQKAQTYMPERESGLPLLLQARAQAALPKHNDDIYLSLIHQPETALLGLQGLSDKANQDGDIARALLIGRQAIASSPKNTSLLKTVYRLELRNKLWNDALLTLKKLQSSKMMTKDEAARDRVSLYLVLGDMALEERRAEEALSFYKMAQSDAREIFPPAIGRLASLYRRLGQAKKAHALLEASWKKMPHPTFLELWDDLWDDLAAPKKISHFVWAQRLTNRYPDNFVSLIGLAQAAIEDGLWGEAKTSLTSAERIISCPLVYRVWIDLERKRGTSTERMAELMDLMRQSERNVEGCGAWVCTVTGRSYAEWMAVIEPEGYFNTLRYQHNARPQANGVACVASVL